MTHTRQKGINNYRLRHTQVRQKGINNYRLRHTQDRKASIQITIQCNSTEVVLLIKEHICYQREVIHALLMTGLDFSDFQNQTQWTNFYFSRTLYLGQTPSQQQTFRVSPAPFTFRSLLKSHFFGQ